MSYIDDKDRMSAVKYIKLKGIFQYNRLVQFLIDLGDEKPSYKDVSALYQYDKRLRDQLYIYLATIEEFIHATLGNEFEDCQDSLVITPRLKSNIETYKSVPLAIEHLMISELKDVILANAEFFNGIYFIDEHLETNLIALKELRNKVGHHNLLLVEKLKKCVRDGVGSNSLTANIRNMQQFLPEDFRIGFANTINKCVDKLSIPEDYIVKI